MKPAPAGFRPWPYLVALGIALVPVLLDALNLFRHATSHVIVAQPTLRDLRISLKFGIILICGAGAFALGRCSAGRASSRLIQRLAGPDRRLVAVQPLALFAVSRITGSSMFVARYLYIGLPGAALAATLAAAYFIPADHWKPLSAVFAVGVLMMLGQWRQPWPMHHGSDWRLAAHTVDQWARNNPNTPVLCPSPFIEARPPVWQPSYALPGFLYCHLPVYPFRGKPYLLPFETRPKPSATLKAWPKARLPRPAVSSSTAVRAASATGGTGFRYSPSFLPGIGKGWGRSATWWSSCLKNRHPPPARPPRPSV